MTDLDETLHALINELSKNVFELKIRAIFYPFTVYIFVSEARNRRKPHISDRKYVLSRRPKRKFQIIMTTE